MCRGGVLQGRFENHCSMLTPLGNFIFRNEQTIEFKIRSIAALGLN